MGAGCLQWFWGEALIASDDDLAIRGCILCLTAEVVMCCATCWSGLGKRKCRDGRHRTCCQATLNPLPCVRPPAAGGRQATPQQDEVPAFIKIPLSSDGGKTLQPGYLRSLAMCRVLGAHRWNSNTECRRPAMGLACFRDTHGE